MDEREVDWSNIPRELLPIIGKSLDARIDVLRFRSVCSSWLSSIPPTNAHPPRFPRKFPPPGTVFGSASVLRGPDYYLCESTLYLFKQPDPFPASSSSRNKAWLIKVEESNSGKLQLFDPLSNHRFRFSPLHQTTLNLLNFQIVELGKAYTLRNQISILPRSGTERNYFLSDRSVTSWLTKVVMSPSSAWSDADESAAVLVLHEGKLAFSRYGDENLTSVDDQNSDYDDIIVYKGQLYVIDKLGNVSWIESSSLRLVQFSPPLCGLGSQKHLLESGESLYVVDRYLEDYNVRSRYHSRTIDFNVYKLDEEWGQWILMKSLGDQAFILGVDCCFSVSASKVVGCKENCIYFCDEQESHIFHLEDRHIDDLGFSMYQPPLFCGAPAWFNSDYP